MILDIDTIKMRLRAYGYESDDRDNLMVQSALETAIHRALSLTNQRKMPRGLEFEVVRMAVGEFLYMKKMTGGLEDGSHGISFKPRITQFTEGDTNISATDKGKNDESNFERWLEGMRMGDPSVLEHFRRIHW